MRKAAKKRVCVFTMHPAKDLRILNRQCYSLQKNGWEVTLIGVAKKSSVGNSKEEEYYNEGVRVVEIRKWSTLCGRIKTIFTIARRAYKQDADIYHFHDPALLIPAVFIRLFTLKPVIYDIHEFYHIVYSSKLPNIWPLRQVMCALIWFVESLCGKICGYISAVYEEHFVRFTRLRCRVVHTPNYASEDDFVPAPVSDKEWCERHKKVIHIGTLDPSKGAYILLDTAKEVRKKRPDIEFIVTRRFLAPWQEKVTMEKLALPEYQNVIQFIENVNGKELPQIVRRGGIGLSPIQNINQNRLAVPTKFFEYMSQAVPVIASNLPPSVKYIGQEQCGILVKPDDPREYADAIIKCVDNPELARQMGTRGQRAFVERYNWGVVEKRLLEFYSSIVS